jgi:hypothetical protein
MTIAISLAMATESTDSLYFYILSAFCFLGTGFGTVAYVWRWFATVVYFSFGFL